MVSIRTAFFAFLLVLAPSVSMAEPGSEGDEPIKTYPRLVREEPLPVEVPDPTVAKGPTALHDAGAKLIRKFICKSTGWCLEKHGPRLTKAAHTVVDVCLSEPGIPKWMCLGFVAAISNEAGGLEHPSCGGLNQDCVRNCDKIKSTGARRSCAVQCAIDQGKGSKTIRRVRRCNDRWSSRGPFQMKPARIRQCQRYMNDKDFDPFSLEQAARCTMRIVKRAATRKGWPCGRYGNRWMVAMKRVGAGVLRKIAPAQPGRWAENPRGGEKIWVPPQKAVYQKICGESRYARRGLRYYQWCGKACQDIDKSAFASLPTPQKQVVEDGGTPINAVPRSPHGG